MCIGLVLKHFHLLFINGSNIMLFITICWTLSGKKIFM